MSFAVRRRTGDRVVTFDIVDDWDEAVGLTYSYAKDHSLAMGKGNSRQCPRVTRLKDDTDQLYGHRLRRSKKHPYVSYVVEESKIVLY